jgi:hypothetical protein
MRKNLMCKIEFPTCILDASILYHSMKIESVMQETKYQMHSSHPNKMTNLHGLLLYHQRKVVPEQYHENHITKIISCNQNNVR